jgi:osmotically-inducible protein OsmY
VIATSTNSDIAFLPASEWGTDGLLRDAAIQGLRRSGYPALSDVQCEVKGGRATLSGVVPSFFLKQIAQAILLRVDGVRGLTNHLEVQSPHCGPSLRKPMPPAA